MKFAPSYGLSFEESQKIFAAQNEADRVFAQTCATESGRAAGAGQISTLMTVPAVLIGLVGGAIVGGGKGALIGAAVLGVGTKLGMYHIARSNIDRGCSALTQTKVQ